MILEDFEDALLNTPGVSGAGGGVTGPGGITDSVDADDGAIDGSGLLGRSYFGGGAAGFTFTFDETALGASLGTIVAPNIGDGNFLSGTAEDRFFGVSNAGGISRIHIFNSVMTGAGSGIEADHLQYGGAQVQEVPEPRDASSRWSGVGRARKAIAPKGPVARSLRYELPATSYRLPAREVLNPRDP